MGRLSVRLRLDHSLYPLCGVHVLQARGGLADARRYRRIECRGVDQRQFVVSCLSMANCHFVKPHGMQHCYMLHPFLYVIDSKRALSFGEAQVVIVGCSQFSRCCHLVIAIDFLLYEEVGRRHLSPSPELGGGVSSERRRPGFESRRARQFPSLALGRSKRYLSTRKTSGESDLGRPVSVVAESRLRVSPRHSPFYCRFQ